MGQSLPNLPTNFNLIKKQVAGAGFRDPLLICLLNLTLNKKSISHSLQFVSKYHVFLDSLWAQIWEHTHHSSGTAKYHVFFDSLWVLIREHKHHSSGTAKYHVFLDSLWPQIWDHTHHNSGLAALYYTAVELENM